MRRLLSLITITLLFTSALSAQFDELIFKQYLKKLEFDTVNYSIYGNNIEAVRLSEKSKSKYHRTTIPKLAQLIGYIKNLEVQLNKDTANLIEGKFPFYLNSDYKLGYVKTLLVRPEINIYTSEINIHQNLYNAEYKRIKENEQAQANKKSLIDKEVHSEAIYKYRMRELSGHDYLSHFHSRELNFAQIRLTGFIYDYLNLSEISNELNNNKLVCKYSSIVSGGTPESVEVVFDVYSKENNLYYIDKVSITGTYKSIINLFVMYWPTKLNADDTRKGEWVYYNMIPDRVGLYVDDYNKARIEVAKSPSMIL